MLCNDFLQETPVLDYTSSMALDFNLLPALEVLLEEQSVVRAADRLNLSPSAMSRTLTRLRASLQDPLLVRAGRGLVPSPRALELRDRVRNACQEARAILGPSGPWDPRTVDRTFTLRFSDGLVEAWGPALLDLVRAQAPGVRLRFVAKTDRFNAGLRQGLVDLETGVIGGPSSPEIVSAPLFEDRLVIVVRPDHPWAHRAPSPEEYLAGRHVATDRGPGEPERLDAWLAAQGLHRNIEVLVSGFASALALATASDLAATVPERHTQALWGALVAVRLPWNPGPIPVSLLWHPRSDADPAHRWLRAAVKRLALPRDSAHREEK